MSAGSSGGSASNQSRANPRGTDIVPSARGGDFNDDEEGVARNLLGFRDQRNWGPSSENGPNGGRHDHMFSPPKTGEVDMTSISHLTTTNIISYYEPKFLEIFLAYSKTTPSKTIDITLPLMSMCLEHLIPFNCWARESNARLQWIRNMLDDNADLRPEVRNGLSMIYIYSFSAGKAANRTGSDMFTVLQDSETGFGIVNKTSLKIYNDPFNFFGFLKACISGLIDCGKLPENERQNQPKKPKKTSNENRDELSAFLQLKSFMVTVLNRGDNNTARTKVEQIMMAWQYRPKEVRTRRFGIAMAVLNNQISVADIPAHLVVPLTVDGGLPSGANIVMNRLNSTMMNSGVAGSTVGLSSLEQSESMELNNPLGGAVVQGVGKPSGPVGSSQNVPGSLGSLISLANASSAMITGPEKSSGAGQIGLATNAAGGTGSLHGNKRPPVSTLPRDQHFTVGTNANVRKSSMNGDDIHNSSLTAAAQKPARPGVPLNLPNMVAMQQQINQTNPQGDIRGGAGTGAGASTSRGGSEDIYSLSIRPTPSSSSSGAMSSLYDLEQLRGQPLKKSRLSSAQSREDEDVGLLRRDPTFNSTSLPAPLPLPAPRIVKALRFERIGLKEWNIKETRLFSIDGLLANNSAAICLIDEGHLSTEEMKDGRLKSSSGGLVTLQSELANRHALITTWPKNDYAHLSDFVLSWQKHSTFPVSTPTSSSTTESSLAKYWHSLTSGGGSTSEALAPGEQSLGGGGALAYEVNMQVGIILRSCTAAGVSEDCWRMIYPSDLQEELYSASFASFLSSFFPQLRSPFSQLKDLRSVVVKYYPHQVQLPLVQPPAKLDPVSYQTLGTIDEDAGTILKRLETSVTLHDFVIQVT